MRRPHPPGEGWDCTSSLDDEGMCGRGGCGGGGWKGGRGYISVELVSKLL